MKIIFVLIIVVWFGLALNLEVHEEIRAPTTFCNAIKSIIKLAILSPPINIQLIDETLADCIVSKQSTVFINYCLNSTRWLSKSSLIIVKDESDISKLLHLCMNHNGNHLVVLHDNSQININELVNYFWRKLLINVSFLVIIRSAILIQTFIPYNDKKCNDTELVTINRFDAETERWKSDQFFPKKLNNFHRCSLTVTTYNNVVPYIVREEFVNGKIKLRGRVIQMIDALAKSLNFTTKLEYEPSVAAWEKCIQRVANYEADLFIGNVFLDLSRTKYLDFTIPIFFEYLKFVVPPGRSYTQIENFARAFDNIIWYMILCVFVLTALLVLILSGRSKKSKIYAFGIGYKNAFMDFLGTILGVTGTSMPDLTIPRIITIKFVIFCFVMRTVYQGSLFNFLQSGGKLKPAQSIEEMTNRGYTYYMLPLYDTYLDTKRRESKRLVNISEFDGILEKISDPSFQGTLLHTSSLIDYKNDIKDKNFTNIFCKEHLMIISMVGYLPKNFYLTDVVNEKIGFFHTAGLIDVWDRRNKKVTVSSADVGHIPKRISITDLKGVFIIYLIAVTFACFCFVSEVTVNIFLKKLS